MEKDMALLQKDIDRQRDDKRKMQDEIDVAKANTKVHTGFKLATVFFRGSTSSIWIYKVEKVLFYRL